MKITTQTPKMGDTCAADADAGTSAGISASYP